MEPTTNMSTRSNSTSSTYSHLLYLSDADRQYYLSSTNLTSTPSPTIRRESVSYFSMTSTRCSSDSFRSELSLVSIPSTPTSSVYTAKIATPKFADDHYPLVSSLQRPSSIAADHNIVRCAREMACIHNTLIRALNSAYNHALTIVPFTKRCEDFLLFNKNVYRMIDHRYQAEKHFLFPALERLLGEPGVLTREVVGYEAFVHGLHRYRDYVTSPDTMANFNGLEFRKIIESFAPSLIQHLHDEIPIMLGLPVATSKKVRRIWTQANRLAVKEGDLYINGPFVLGCQDKTFLIDGEKGEFPSVPWGLENLVRRWHAKKYAGVWEFCPSDLQGNRRLLDC